MKFYESHYEEYLQALEDNNFHPQKPQIYGEFSNNIRDLPNFIFYGASGVGKYSQVLSFLKKYSPSKLKYEKKIEITYDKLFYAYRISDIHYEIDVSLLGCNSKTVWNDFFNQIIDIISNGMKTEKTAFIVCKNFHLIHNELLDIFYSYIQQYKNNIYSPLFLRFILITEQISFIPQNIYQSCHVFSFARPSLQKYASIIHPQPLQPPQLLNHIQASDIVNAKEMKAFYRLNKSQIPIDIFNVVCDDIIQEMIHPEKIVFVDFRDKIYNILIYNLEVVECVEYIFSVLIQYYQPSKEKISPIFAKIYDFLKYYNNNYRPIYHLESIFFTIITKLNE